MLLYVEYYILVYNICTLIIIRIIIIYKICIAPNIDHSVVLRCFHAAIAFGLLFFVE